MANDPDTKPGAEGDDVPEEPPELVDPGINPDDPAGDGPEPPRTPEGRIAAVFRQWQTPGRPTSDVVALKRTTSDAPDGLPYLDLLGVDEAEIVDAWTAWDAAQVASDATPLGRALRPVVALIPAGGRWIAGRSFSGTCILEPIDHPTPARAIRAAQARYELIASRRVSTLLDDLIAPTQAGLEPLEETR